MLEEEQAKNEPLTLKNSVDWKQLFLQFISVTFGVLFAFQLSQWQQDRDEKKIFDRLLERVAIENRQNVVKCEQHLLELDEELNDFAQSFAAINDSKIPADSLARILAKHLSVPTTTYSTSNLEAALHYDNSRYREDLIPILNELIMLEDETRQFGDLRLEYFTNKMIPALGEQLDFETDLPIESSFKVGTQLKNQLLVHNGLCSNTRSITTNYKASLLSFDSLARQQGWINK